MTRTVRVGLSTCPNDTFAFHALLTGEVRAPGLALEFDLADVEELNRRMLADELDVAKISFHAALALGERVRLLTVGAALGFGVGPVLLARPGWRAGRPRASRPRVLTPGRWTTARLLYELFRPVEGDLEDCVFSAIMPRLAAGDAELGVCIHEGRFTWRDHGLELVGDLGERWEERTGAPLPLGGIAASARLPRDDALRFQDALSASLEWARARPEATLSTLRAHAQETSDEILWKHVELYVSEATLELGEEGRAALDALAEAARRAALPDCVGLPPFLA